MFYDLTFLASTVRFHLILILPYFNKNYISFSSHNLIVYINNAKMKLSKGIDYNGSLVQIVSAFYETIDYVTANLLIIIY